MTSVKAAAVAAIVPLLMVAALQILQAYPSYPWHPFVASDPGVRGGPAGAGDHLAGLTESQRAFFERAKLSSRIPKTPQAASGRASTSIDASDATRSLPAAGRARSRTRRWPLRRPLGR